MPKFERHFAGVPTEAATLPRAPVRQLADTGQGLEARALQQAGAGLQDIAGILFKWNEREGNRQYDASVGEAHAAFGEFERTAFADTTEHEKAYKTLTEKTIPSLAGKNKSGAKKFQAYIKGKQKAAWDRTAAEKQIRMIAGNNLTGYLDDMQNVARDYPDEESAMQRLQVLVEGAIDDRTRTQAQAASDYEKGVKNWAEVDVWRQATKDVRPDGEVDWSQAVNWLNQPGNTAGIDPDIVKSLKSNAETEKGNQKRRDDGKINNLQNQQRDNIYDMIENNAEDTLKTINNSSLGGEEKAGLRKLARNPDVSLNYLEYDKVVDIIDGVARDTHTEEQADEAIKAGVGKYFDVSQATSLRTKLSQNSKADSPTKRPAHTGGIKTIEEIMDANIKAQKAALGADYSFEAESKDLQTKNKMKNDFNAWALEKDRTDEEIEKKIKSLTRSVIEEVTLGFFSRLLRKEKGGQLFGLVASEEKALVNKKIDKLKEQDFWETLTDDDKTAIRKRLEQGDTVDNIVRLATQ